MNVISADIDNKKTIQDIVAWCTDYISRNLNIPAEEIHPTAPFDSFGLDSAVTTAMLMDLEDWLGVEVPPSAVFEQENIQEMASTLASKG